MTQLLATVLRGLRARALLSVGSIVLTALAVGSAVLGPIFSEAVTNSYVVTRLREAPAASTGLVRVLELKSQLDPQAARDLAVEESAALDGGPWGESTTTLVSAQYSALRGVTRFWAREHVCGGLEVTGRCPSAPGEVLMLNTDAEKTGAVVGEPLELPIFEPPEIEGRYPRPPLDEVLVVGTYTTPQSDDVWAQPTLLTTTNEQSSLKGGYTPYQPAPLITTTDTVASLGPGEWTVRVDTPLAVPADLTRDDLDAAAATAARLDQTTEVAGGVLVGVPDVNNLGAVRDEVREQQATARASIAPAVLSLVLVALALLMRLLMAASEIRVPELALASLRGVSSRKLWVLGLSEPLVVLAVSAPIGAALGLGMGYSLTRAWLVEDLPVPVPWVSWAAAGLVMLAAVAVACVAVGLVVRDTLASQLSGVRRPQSSRRWSVVAQLALVALALAVLVSKLASGTAGDPDATDLVLPVLLAIVAGLAATRATAWLATWWTRRGQHSRSLGSFVSTRAISRRQEGTLVILPVTAAIAVAVFGAGVYDSAATWRASVAATASPGEVTWTSPLSLRDTRDLTRRIDPDGEWVMTAAEVQNPGANFSVVDADRLASIAVWPPTWTPGRTVEEVAASIETAGAVPSLVGRRLSLTIDNRAMTSSPLAVEVRLGSVGGTPERVYVGPFPRGEHTLSERLPRTCATACPLEGITLGGGAGTTMEMDGTARVVEVAVDGTPVEGAIEGAGWVAAPDSQAPSSVAGLSTEDGTIDLQLDTDGGVGMARLTSGGITLKRPAVRGVDVSDEAIEGLDGSGVIGVEPRGTAEGLPFVGPTGLLVDFASFVNDRPVYDNLFQTRVLMRDGAPAEVRDALEESGLTVETTLAAEQRVLDQSAYALALRLYAVVAALVLLMALAGLFVSTAVQLPARRRDAAALRVVGVPRGAVMSAVAREFLVVLGGAAVAGILAGSLAQYVVLRTITLGYVEDLSTPRLVAEISPLRLVVLAAIAAVVLGIAAFVSASITVRGARGSTLRESAR
ncbi:FtsX-like permease family protein [Nocardioides sp. Soil805]|uniref:FtsX-like permease family protein n=1 Tax=Nocardioides sp. Soil805 TaxID=1736416 RepID=UPI000702BFCB|nr:FtsX-like permease family protein [Nocardioides sp. Soil805]KRF34623.1 hypothetical protein ASG94_10590 [Nocardioides sp. Soil805]